jgi:hypothetical protein
VAVGEAESAAFEAVVERFTNSLPRIAGSDLQEARASAESAAAAGGEAREPDNAAMGR